MIAFVAILALAASASAGLLGAPAIGVQYASPAVAAVPAAISSTNAFRVSQSVHPVAYAQHAPVAVAQPIAYAQPAVAYAHAPVVKTVAPVAASTAYVNRAPAARIAIAQPALAVAQPAYLGATYGAAYGSPAVATYGAYGGAALLH